MARMTERQVWLKIAEAWDAAKVLAPRSYYVTIFNGYVMYGICPCIEQLVEEDKISFNLGEKMLAKIKAETGAGENSWAFPHTKSGAKKRAALCRKFAKECPSKKGKKT